MSEEEPKKHLTWTEFGYYMKKLPGRVEMDPDTILGIARGGLPGATMLAHAFDADIKTVSASRADKGDDWDITINRFPKIREDEKVLIFDEVVDTGNTMGVIHSRAADRAEEVETASLHKSSREDMIFTPDSYIVEEDRWVCYPWEI